MSGTSNYPPYEANAKGFTEALIDLKDTDVSNLKIKKNIPGKKIKSIEVLVKIANNN